MAAFSAEAYHRIISSFLESGYRILPLGHPAGSGERVVYLRHDVDYSLGVACELASINRDLGIAGCYCVPVRSDLINLAAESSLRSLEQILAEGQTIGLHFYLPSDLDPADIHDVHTCHDRLLEDFELLQKVTSGRTEPVVSWHNPSVLGDRFRHWVAADVPGLTNAYGLERKGVTYVSDSNHRYTVEKWIQMAEDGPDQLHALFHPFQWILGADTVDEVLANTWSRIIREREQLFLTNHVYRARFPDGLPQPGLNAFVRPLLDLSDARRAS